VKRSVETVPLHGLEPLVRMARGKDMKGYARLGQVCASHKVVLPGESADDAFRSPPGGIGTALNVEIPSNDIRYGSCAATALS